MAGPVRLPQPLRILLVEDNPNDVQLILAWIQRADPVGLTVQNAMTLADALRLLMEQSFDLTVLDLGLPDSQGLDSLHQLQKSAPDMPVVVLTGGEDEVLRALVLTAGAQDYLVKGHFEPEYWLVRVLRYAAERHHLQKRWDEERIHAKNMQELYAFESLRQSTVPVTASLYGQKNLADYDPALFQTLMQTYRDVLEQAIERQVYKVEHAVSHKLTALAEQLGFLRAGPRDVIELHSRVLEAALSKNIRYASKIYTDEGRLIVLELMGCLANYYRRFYQTSPTARVTEQERS